MATKFMFPGLKLLCHILNQTVVPHPKLKFIWNPNTFLTNKRRSATNHQKKSKLTILKIQSKVYWIIFFILELSNCLIIAQNLYQMFFAHCIWGAILKVDSCEF